MPPLVLLFLAASPLLLALFAVLAVFLLRNDHRTTGDRVAAVVVAIIAAGTLYLIVTHVHVDM